MTKVKVKIEGHYEVEEIPYGKDYRWVPAHALIECDCGRVMDVDSRHTVCPGCGSDHAAVIEEIAGRHLADEDLRPWRRDYEAQAKSRQGHREDQEWLEQRSLD